MILTFQPRLEGYVLTHINEVPYGKDRIVTIGGVDYEITATPDVFLLFEQDDNLVRIQERRAAEGRRVRR